MAQKQPSRLQVVSNPPQISLLPRAHMLRKQAIRPSPRHQQEIPSLTANINPSHRNCLKAPLNLLPRSRHWIQRDPEISRQRVRTPQRNDPQNCGSLSCWTNQSLRSIVDRPVPTTGKHNFSPARYSFPGLFSGGTRCNGSRHHYIMPQPAKLVGHRA